MKKKRCRSLFRSTIVLILVIFAAYAFMPPGNPEQSSGSSAQDDLQTIKKRIISDLLGPPANSARVQELIRTIRPDGSWPGINYKDTSRTGFQHSIHLENMFTLARAYRKEGNADYLNPEVKKTVSAALDFWIAHDFICENWWWNEMGTPNWMINTLLVLDTALTPRERTEGVRIASRASLTGFGARAGGDFVPIAGMVCKQGLFQNNDSILQHAIEVMTDQVVITTARGINPDMGFHHRTDNVTSIHTYGTNYVNAFSYWAVKTAGTRYALPGKALNLLIDYYIDGISKCMAYGIYSDAGAQNRDLSRRGALEAAGTDIPENLLSASGYRKKELEYLVAVRKGTMRPTLTWDRYYWHSSYFAHQRKPYYASVRMYSLRQNNMEEPYNEEGLRMHHLADGSNFISRTGREYFEVFPVWDWQKIPGTTVVQRAELPPPKEIARKGLTAFVGAASDGQFGVCAFDFKSVHDPLTARKAWFFFDREWVCLGNSIRSEADDPVATTLNQCLLRGKVIVKTSGGQQALQTGQHPLTGVSWVLHDSVAYIFPAPADIQLSNMTATGNWRLISHQAWATEAPVQKDLFTLWLNHGRKPEAAGYAYFVLPAATAALADQYCKHPDVSILSNTASLQAVWNRPLAMTQVVFYQPGTLKISNGLTLSAKDPCIVMIRMSGNKIAEITAADPAEKLSSLRLEVSARLDKTGKGFIATWDQARRVSAIDVELPAAGMAGSSVRMDF